MKKRLRAFICVLCVLALTVTPTFAAWGDDVSYGEMRATSQQYTDGSNTQIKSFTLNDTFNYETLGSDSGKTTLTLSTNNLQDIVKTKLMPQWSGIAASVFRDQATQLVDLYGEEPIGENMSQIGFDAYFNMNRGETKYKDEVWSTYSLKSKLEQTTGSHAGKRGYDQLSVSGVKRISKLNDARNLMAQSLYDCQNTTGALSVQEFLDADEAGETRLEGLDSDDAMPGFANVVTAVNCKGSSANFDYVSFGIVFYDFQPVPVAATGLQYVSGPTPTGDVVPGGANNSVITNGSAQDILHSAVLGDSVTQTTTTNLSGLASFELSENIGAGIGLSQTESSSETSFWSDDTFGSGSSTSTSSESMSMGLDWGTAWKMGGALGAEQGHSESKEVSKAVETTISLPAHTGTTVEQETSTTTYAQTYQQPAVLSYKVAIYAMSGDFYSSSAFGGIGGINTSDYDKQSMVIKFDTNDSEKPSYGCAATDDLYCRVTNNNQVDSYDISNDRTYTTHSTAWGWEKSEEIHWGNVAATARDYYGVDVPALSKQNFFYESPGKVESKTDKTTSHVASTYPLYNLASVKTPKANYVLYDKNMLDLDSITVEGYNRYSVPFYGFTSDWGEWQLCDEKGVVYGSKTLASESAAGKFLYDSETRTLAPKSNAESQSIYIRWVIKDGVTQVTNESPNGQDLTDLNNVPTNDSPALTPVVRIDIVNTGLDNPRISASGGYAGFYRTPINLNDTMNYVVTNKTGKKIDTQVRWESYELESEGIVVNEGTGDVQFTQPGVYHVRPFVVNNDGDQVVPLTSDGDYDWLTVTATEHNLTHYDAKAPTDCTGGDAYGWIEHYRCSDCGKYFLDAEGSVEAAEDDVIIPPTGHNWGEWTPSNDPGVEKRVCKNNANHVEYRNVYTVTFDMNEPDNAPAAAQGQPDAQTFTSDVTASVKAPTAPTLTGYTFEGWCTDEEGNNLYDFSEPVSASMTLYAKWAPVKYTIATVAVVNKTAPDTDGGTQQVITPATGSYIYFGNPTTDEQYLDDENYLYFYTEAAYGETVEMTVSPAAKFGMSEIWAIPVLAVSDTDASVGEAFEPEQVSGNVYKVTMPASDLAVMGGFVQERVDVTYNAGTLSGNPNVGLPTNEEIQYGHAIDGLDGKTPTLSGDLANTTEFAGWFTDAELTKPCLSNTALTADTTLYAKWVDKTNPPTLRTITYTLVYNPTVDIDPDVASYTVESGSTIYDPTADVYALADDSTQAQYALLEGDKSCWFKGDETTTPDFSNAESFDFDTTVSENTYLYAQVVPRTYTVTYYDGNTQLGTQEVEYGTHISQSDADAKAPHKDGQALAGWTTNGTLWAFGEDSVTSNLALYANWDYEVTFNANGHGTAPDTQVVKYGEKATKPNDPTAEGYEFGGWYTDAACTQAYNFDDEVTAGVTLYAKWTETNPTSVAMHRLYNPNGGEHFYTASDEERDGLVKLGWQYEGTGWTAPITSNTPVHRLYNPNGGDHHYTMSAEERDWLVSLGWKYEGIGWYSDDAKTVKLYREYNPNAQSGSHNYTTSLEEHKNLVKLGWHDEGTAWYGL